MGVRERLEPWWVGGGGGGVACWVGGGVEGVAGCLLINSCNFLKPHR